MVEADPARLLAMAAPVLTAMLLAPLIKDTAPIWRSAPYLLTGLGGLIAAAIAIAALLNGTEQPLLTWSATPFAAIAFRLDPLAAYFLLVIGGVAAVVSLYATAYTAHGPRSGGWGACAYAAFILALMLLVLSDSVLAFLILWELMSLTSFLLVIQDHRSPEARRAALTYLVMTHVGTACLLVAFLLLAAHAGSLDFGEMRAASASLDTVPRSAIFLLALAGFGTKAGIIPLHVWLPRAHPAAPSHVSALMSGVMIKLGIFGLVRVGWELAGPGPAWWGWLLLGLGVVSAVLGVLYALMEHDLKRLLAFHSIENIGIILIGLGTAFIARAAGQPSLAALALVASLFHVLNHAVFKALLFLGAGAVQQAARTRNLERLGGLIRRMPWTAVAFLVGSAAISALPPLNGFASEWLTFQGLLGLGHAQSTTIPALGAGISAALLGMTGALAAACFVKAFGIAFLAQPRTDAARDAQEAPAVMVLAMVVLALGCIGLGLVPGAALRVLEPVTLLLTGTTASSGIGVGASDVAASGAYAPLIVLALVVALSLLPVLLGRLIGGPARTRVSPTWVCGVALEPSMQYSATALTKPIRVIFRALLRPYREVELRHSLAPYFVSGLRYHAGIGQTYERFVYRPLVRGTFSAARRVRLLQNGNVRIYLSYVCATLLVVLLIASR